MTLPNWHPRTASLKERVEKVVVILNALVAGEDDRGSFQIEYIFELSGICHLSEHS